MNFFRALLSGLYGAMVTGDIAWHVRQLRERGMGKYRCMWMMVKIVHREYKKPLVKQVSGGMDVRVGED